jgi:hypothetical protein
VVVSECRNDVSLKGLVRSVHVYSISVAPSARDIIPFVSIQLLAKLRSGDYVVSLQAARKQGACNDMNAIILLLIYRFWKKEVGEPYVFS